MKRRLLASLLCLLLIRPTFADGLPDLGDVASAELSPQAERKLGLSVMRQIRWHDPSYLDDSEVEEYLNTIGHRLAADSAAPQLDFEFFAVNDSTINAFALPGGYVGVNTGLLLAVQSESELASVLGHEIGHVTQRHVAQMVARQGQSMLLMLGSLLVAVLAARNSPDTAQAAVMAGQSIATESSLSYSREFEHEADRQGLQTMEAAGFDVRGMVSFFGRLQRESRVYENNAPAYFRTHPLTTERISDMENRVEHMPYHQVPDSLEFQLVRAKLRAMDGPAPDALAGVQAEIAARGTPTMAQNYTLARAALRADRPDLAEGAVAALAKSGVQDPMIATLMADLKMAQKKGPEAIALLEQAVRHWPTERSLRYALEGLRIRNGKSGQAILDARAWLADHSQDARMWASLAQAQAAEGKLAAQHQAQAEVYALHGNTAEAIQQLELARKAPDADFYQLSAVEARLAQLKQRLREEMRDKNGL